MAINPPQRIVGERVVVRSPCVGDGPALVEAVTASIEHLRPWMPWIEFEPQSVEQRGRGVCTEATRLMTAVAFELPGITEVLICCDAANLASAAIPAKLGYTVVEQYRKEPAAPGETGVHLRWRMTADDWARRSGLVR